MKTVLFSVAVFAAFTLSNLTLFGQIAENNNLGSIKSGGTIGIGSVIDDGLTTNVVITGNRGYINWNQFGIDNNYTGNFHFSNGNGIILNHVTGGSATAINGLLTSNGNVYVINPNGLTIGSSGVISTKGLVGTTFSLDENDARRFVNNQTNTLNFTRRADTTVSNSGEITATDGNVVLMGARVSNLKDGKLYAPNGSVELLVGGGATVVHNGPSHPLITVSGMSSPFSGTGIDQRGFIEANAARLEAVGGNVMALAINNTGTIRATQMHTTAEGKVLLKAVGGNIDIKSGVIATYDGDIDIEATKGNVYFGIDPDAAAKHSNTMVNAYGTGNVTVKAQNITLDANQANAYISVGSNHGKTTVTTTVGDLTIKSTKGGYAQVGYHFRMDDDRIFSWDENENSLFSGFNDTRPNSAAMQELGKLMVPTGDIDVDVAKDLIIFASYDKTNPDSLSYLPAAHIGHAYLASDKETGKLITAYNVVDDSGDPMDPDNLNTRLQMLGITKDINNKPIVMNINVKVVNDVKITSEGASIARVGHNVRNFVSFWSRDSETNEEQLHVNNVHGNIILKAGRDILITARDGGTSGVGHVGDEFHQGLTLSTDGLEYGNAYQTTAGQHTVLDADGSRPLANDDANGGTWHSIAQIGSNIMGKAAGGKVTGTGSDPRRILAGGIDANIIALSGANMSLTGKNGSTSVIGHENNSSYKYSYSPNDARYRYGGTVIVGYSFNRYKELNEDNETLKHSMGGAMYEYYKKLNDIFTGKEEGYLEVDGNSRIGKEYDVTGATNINKQTWVAIFGFRMMRDGKTNAIRLANGAQLGTGKIDTGLNPGQYDNSQGTQLNFRYKISDHGDDTNIEYYGYTYADYDAKNDDLFDFLAFGIDEMGKLPEQTLRIFYPTFNPEKPRCKKPPRPEEPRYPLIPVWFEPCPCQPCCVPCCEPCYDPCRVECYEPVTEPCRPVTTTCESFLPDDGTMENREDEVEVLPVPTLAPPKPENLQLELLIQEPVQ